MEDYIGHLQSQVDCPLITNEWAVNLWLQMANLIFFFRYLQWFGIYMVMYNTMAKRE